MVSMEVNIPTRLNVSNDHHVDIAENDAVVTCDIMISLSKS
jgi:hypothetical protein